MFRTADFELPYEAPIGKELESFPTWLSLPPTLFAWRINTPYGNCSASRRMDRGIDSLSKNFKSLKAVQGRVKQSHSAPDKAVPAQPVDATPVQSVDRTMLHPGATICLAVFDQTYTE